VGIYRVPHIINLSFCILDLDPLDLRHGAFYAKL
jgi:hypothetical protein